jgi:predicted RNase H-like HicB family nuclease
MAKYVFPAIFSGETDGGYTVKFPDVKGCLTQGDDMADAVDMAEDVLCLMLYHIEENGDEPPEPSEPGEFILEENEIVSLVHCDTMEYRRLEHNAQCIMHNS